MPFICLTSGRTIFYLVAFHIYALILFKLFVKISVLFRESPHCKTTSIPINDNLEIKDRGSPVYYEEGRQWTQHDLSLHPLPRWTKHQQIQHKMT
jgi:hypothetical protein